MFSFFVPNPAPPAVYTLSLHDALPIFGADRREIVGLVVKRGVVLAAAGVVLGGGEQDRKSTRLNSSHGYTSYAVFCLKKKKDLKQPPLHLEHHGDVADCRLGPAPLPLA